MRRILAVIVSLCMILTLFAGCAGSGKDSGKAPGTAALDANKGNAETMAKNTKDTAESKSGNASDGSENSSDTESGDGWSYDFSDRPHYTIKIMMFGDANSEDCDAVAAKLSEITEEKLNADVELVRVGFGSFETQLNLALSSGEELDLFNPHAMSLTTFVNNGQIKELDGLLDTYGKQLKQQISQEDWQCTSVNGKIYAVPSNKEKAHGIGFIMRKDILDDIGMSVDDIRNLDDLHDVLAKVKESNPDLYPVVTNYGSLFYSLPIDTLGDTNNLGVLTDPYGSKELKVENFYESDFYNEICTRMYQWNKEGLLMPDGSTNSEGAKQLIKAGKGFGQFINENPVTETERSLACGTDMVYWEYYPPISMTNDAAYGMCIGENSGDPERAMALIELMYTDFEVSNLIINGIEGMHYRIVDQENGIIDYPEGKDISNVGYSRYPYGWPNQQLSMVWNGYSLDIWEQYSRYNDSAIQSPAKGFIFDNSSVLNEITACSNIVGKYNNALLCGSLDPKETLEAFNKELYDAGLQRIMDEKQTQLDAWAQSK